LININPINRWGHKWGHIYSEVFQTLYSCGISALFDCPRPTTIKKARLCSGFFNARFCITFEAERANIDNSEQYQTIWPSATQWRVME